MQRTSSFGSDAITTPASVRWHPKMSALAGRHEKPEWREMNQNHEIRTSIA
jgi:hypothetical protein